MNLSKWMSLLLTFGLGLNSAAAPAFAAVGRAVSGPAANSAAAVGSAGAATRTVPVLNIQAGLASPAAAPLSAAPSVRTSPTVAPGALAPAAVPAARTAPQALAPAAASGRTAASRGDTRLGGGVGNGTDDGAQPIKDRRAVRAKVADIGGLVANVPAARLSAADAFRGGVRIEDALTGARSHAGLGDVAPAMSAGLRARTAALRAAAGRRTERGSDAASVPAPEAQAAGARSVLPWVLPLVGAAAGGIVVAMLGASAPMTVAATALGGVLGFMNVPLDALASVPIPSAKRFIPVLAVTGTLALLAVQAYLPAAAASLGLFALTGTVAEDAGNEPAPTPNAQRTVFGVETTLALTYTLGSGAAAYGVAAGLLGASATAAVAASAIAAIVVPLAWIAWRTWSFRRRSTGATPSRAASASAAEWLAQMDEAGAADPELQAEVDKVQALMAAVQAEMAKVIVNNPEHETMVRLMLLAAIGGENILLEALPGEGKTMTIRALAGAVDLPFSRIQFDPEKMPSDIKGAEVLEQDPETGRREFAFRKGPVFANIVLADEINRGTPKTQAAMLEAMAERQVTVGKTTYDLPQPFFVMATQNPVEQEGTYPLPEAQLDRFMFKYTLPQADLGEAQDRAQVRGIMELNRVGKRAEAAKVATGADLLSARAVAERVRMDESLNEYILNILEAAGHPARYGLSGEVKWMLSKRASIAIAKAARIRAMTEGRTFVVPADIRFVVPHILRHRIALAPGSRKLTTDALIQEILDKLPVDPAGAAKLKSREAPSKWAARAAAGRKWLKAGLRWTGTLLKWLALPALGLGLWWFGSDIWGWLTTQAPVLNDWAEAVKTFLQGSQAGR